MSEQRPETIIDSWPSLSDFAKDAGVSYGAAKQMRRRNSIPVQYWAALVIAAKARGQRLTAADLMSAHAPQAAKEKGAV
jgi:hypothetical protein